jgi:hypothetical protein
LRGAVVGCGTHRAFLRGGLTSRGDTKMRKDKISIYMFLLLGIFSAQFLLGCHRSQIQECHMTLSIEHKMQKVWGALQMEKEAFMLHSGLHILLTEILHDGVYKLQEKNKTYRIVSATTTTQRRCRIRLRSLHYIPKGDIFLKDLYKLVKKNQFDARKYSIVRVSQENKL